MMMTTRSIVLVLALGSCVCEPQNDCKEESSNSLCALCSVTQGITMLLEKVKLLETRLEKSQKDVEELKSLSGDQHRVAFSATLSDTGSGNTGPYSVNTPLKYQKVFSNIGSSYNPSTGVFTAMVKGMYFFRFSMFNNLNAPPNSVVSLKKNGNRLVSVWDVTGTDANDMGSNAVVIAMEAGDNVYVELLANRVVYDDTMHYNTFSGFLLFTM